MKTADLVRLLQEADPSGELEVTVGKTDIWFLQVLPCYYDGYVEILKRDQTTEYYNVLGAEKRGHGYHVMIETHSIADMLNGDPDLPVTFDCPAGEEKYGQRIESMRQEVRNRRSKTP